MGNEQNAKNLTIIFDYIYQMYEALSTCHLDKKKKLLIKELLLN
jgi:hypothetical protein